MHHAKKIERPTLWELVPNLYNTFLPDHIDQVDINLTATQRC